MTKFVGVLTSGGDNPGLNAAIRGLGKAALGCYGMQVIGFRDGFRGLMENRSVTLDGKMLSGILTQGGTILGTSRDKPHKMMVGGKEMDMTQAIIDNYERNHLDVLVCIGGGGTQKNAFRLMEQGLNIITLPKTIDNDVWGTDVTFGFDTALGIATEAIDRLHSTAQSHHRVIVVEIMGHKAGWLALGAGLAGGADVILIPEIPYDTKAIAESIKARSRSGKSFSIIAVAEGALSRNQRTQMDDLEDKLRTAKDKDEKKQVKKVMEEINGMRSSHTMILAQKLEELTGIESRVTILGHLQRGGTPSAADRILATKLGTACAEFINREQYGVMLAARGDGVVGVPLSEVAGKLKTIPVDHLLLNSARRVGTCLGD
jgi:ATP-dependent phosphofructokinase / diphosphate-dependent phosphofructokinase